MRFNLRLLALSAAYYNIFSNVMSIIFLLSILITYALLDDLEPTLTDDYNTRIAKTMPKVMMFIWLVLEIVGPLICVRCIKGIVQERIALVAQYLVWKGIEVTTFAISLIFFCLDLEKWDTLAFPLPCTLINSFLLIAVFLHYRDMPEESSDEEDA